MDMQSVRVASCAVFTTIAAVALVLIAMPQARAGTAGTGLHSLASIRALLESGNDEAAGAGAGAALASTPPLPDPQRAELHALLAQTRLNRLQAVAAISSATEAIALAGSEPAQRLILIHARRVRGLAQAELRQSAAALDDLREAGRLSREHSGADSTLHAAVLGDISVAQRMAGDYGGAMTTLEQALAIQRRQVDRNAGALALNLLRLGQVQRITSDLDRAEATYREALAFDARAPDARGRVRADLLYALGNLERHRERPEQAIEWYARAVPAFTRAYGADSLKLARVLNNYGNAESVRPGRHDAAIALFRRALDIATRNTEANPGDYFPLANIAMIDVWHARHRQAEGGFRAMLARLGNMPAASEATPLFAQHGLAAALWGQGRFDEAFDAAVAAEHTRQAGVRAVAAGFSDEQTLVFQEQEYATLDLAVAIAIASKRQDLLERAWSLAMSARGQVTALQSARLNRARTRLESDPAIAPLWHEWLAANSALESARLAAAPTLATAQAALERAERRLAQALPREVAVTDMQADLADVRRALPAGSALAWLFVRGHLRAEDFASREMNDRDPEWHALVLDAGVDAPIRVLPLAPAQRVTTELAAWQAALADPAASLPELQALGRKVAALVWTPLATATQATRLFVLADDPLQRVAWPALPDGDGYLLDSPRLVHVLNHEAELLDPPAHPVVPRYGVLAVADPAPAPPSRTRGQRERCRPAWSALPGARREVALLRAMIGADHDPPMLALLGDAASESAFRRAAPHASILHLATHGIDAARARDCIERDDRRGVSFAAEAAGPPAIATALVLAAPARAGDPADDGILGSLEIAALDLRTVHWTVLAACSTAAGAMRHYEGLGGLARAFRIAGARTVIVSLWPVDDQATAQWSEALYAARLRSGADTPQALRAAQRAVFDARRAASLSTHPFYWAGFIALGDWR